jgi:hypothetical protein
MVLHESYFPTGQRLLRDGRRDQPFGLELTTHRLHNFGRDRQVSGDLRRKRELVLDETT